MSLLRDLDLTAVTTLLCDADGNLFPSEEPAFEASVTVTNRLLEQLGSPDRYDADTLRRVALGRNFRGLAQDLARDRGLDLAPDDLDVWVAEEARVVTAHLGTVLAPDPRVIESLSRLRDRLDLAVVSSSALPRLAACFTATGLDGLFPADLRYSAQDSLPSPTSKPDPAVYLHALERLGLRPEQGLAVEDATAGVLSAVGAGIPVVGNLVFVSPDERPERRDDLLGAGAVTVVADWQELEDLAAAARPEARRVRS